MNPEPNAPDFDLALRRIDAPVSVWRADVDHDRWQATADKVARLGGRLVALWGSAAPTRRVSAAYAVPTGLLWVELALAPDEAAPDIVRVFRCAGRMQRAATDLAAIRFDGADDGRPWLDHGVWPEGFVPLGAADDAGNCAEARTLPANYPFVTVQGDGVHEIAVGPVHAGIIEPGHFRFSVVGEKVLRLEERLGYVHKGIERRFTELDPLDAHRLAGRVSGDSTVAFAWAFCMALESALGVAVPARARWLRALMLERERVANHLGDLGALGNDAALAISLAQFSRLREDWQRISARAFGHRLMMDSIVPGGVASDLDASQATAIAAQCDEIEREVRAMRAIYDEHAGLQDRFMTTGRIGAERAALLGLCGLAARASGVARDLRRDQPFAPYDELDVSVCVHADGDVAARVAVRFDEIFESLRLIRRICAALPAGESRTTLVARGAASLGAGWVEGWRGEVFVALTLDASGRIARCHCHDPSWQNWPALEHAVIGNIVPDFPLINKSFNLSYSGHDL